MNSSTSSYHPDHFLSDRSIELERNVFIWSSNGSDRFIGGLRVDETRPLTVSALYRWLDLLADMVALVPRQPYVLRLVKIVDTNNGIFSYRPELTEKSHVLDRNSDAPVIPGDYAAYHPLFDPLVDDVWGRKHRCGLTVIPSIGMTFARRETKALKEATLEEVQMYTISPVLRQSALARDRSCVITGVSVQDEGEGTFRVVWIVPPAAMDAKYNLMYKHLDGRAKKWKPDIRPYLALANTLTLRKDVADLFTQTKCGIDVDDNYRIVFFGKRQDDEMFQRLAGLRRPVGATECEWPSDDYLRQHFQQCLAQHVLHGHIREEDPTRDPSDFLEVFPPFEDPTNPVWQTTFGKEVLRYVFATGMTKSSDY